MRKRRFPIIGSGDGVLSFIHLEDAAAATVLAVEQDGAGIYNIVDDEPAPAREWVPALAKALGAKPPRHFPAWLARIVAGRGWGHRGNPVPRRLERQGQARTGWELRYPSWRQGFVAVYGATAAADGSKARTVGRTTHSSI